MAVTLRCNFKDASGEDMSMNFKHADKTKGANVRAFMETVIGNAAVYVKKPISLVSAEFIETLSTDIPL